MVTLTNVNFESSSASSRHIQYIHLDWPLDELDNPTLGHNLVGKQLKLKWKKEGCQLLELGETGGVDHWLGAECIAFNAITRAHRVQYTDADEEDLNMLQAERDWFVTK